VFQRILGRFADLDAWLSTRAAADEFSGVVLIRCGEQTVFSGAYGWASRRWPVPNTRATRFDTASITKLFTSVAALQLLDVGLAIEEITGTAYRDHVRDAVFARAGMTASDFYDRREAAANVAEGWDPVIDAEGRTTGWKQNIFSYPPIGSPDGGAHATADDLVRFLRAVRSGEPLSAERTEQFLTPQVLHHEHDGSRAYMTNLTWCSRLDATNS
jgi:CubicO group peptidase (beta-lactamase class C family)